VQVLQFFAVVLQSWTKLPLMGAFVSVNPRLGPTADLGVIEYTGDMGAPSAPFFWIIFAALVVNGTLPPSVSKLPRIGAAGAAGAAGALRPNSLLSHSTPPQLFIRVFSYLKAMSVGIVTL